MYDDVLKDLDKLKVSVLTSFSDDMFEKNLYKYISYIKGLDYLSFDCKKMLKNVEQRDLYFTTFNNIVNNDFRIIFNKTITFLLGVYSQNHFLFKLKEKAFLFENGDLFSSLDYVSFYYDLCKEVYDVKYNDKSSTGGDFINSIVFGNDTSFETLDSYYNNYKNELKSYLDWNLSSVDRSFFILDKFFNDFASYNHSLVSNSEKMMNVIKTKLYDLSLNNLLDRFKIFNIWVVDFINIIKNTNGLICYDYKNLKFYFNVNDTFEFYLKDLSDEKHKIALSLKESSLLLFFLKNLGHEFNYSVISKEIGVVYSDVAGVQRVVNRLCKKIPVEFINIRKIGYSFGQNTNSPNLN